MTLWTPDGERPIPPRQSPEPGPEESGPGRTAAAGQPTEGEAGSPDQAELSPEQQEQAEAMAREMAEARARLRETPVATVLVNHALGIYELAAIHLTADDADLAEAKLAIDALAALLDSVAGRIGEDEPTLKEALHQARMVYVQRTQQAASPATED